MSTQHEALKLADYLESNRDNGYISSTDEEERAFKTIRQQHALIVQMAEALEAGLQAVYIESTQAERQQYEDAIAATKDYLK